MSGAAVLLCRPNRRPARKLYRPPRHRHLELMNQSGPRFPALHSGAGSQGLAEAFHAAGSSEAGDAQHTGTHAGVLLTTGSRSTIAAKRQSDASVHEEESMRQVSRLVLSVITTVLVGAACAPPGAPAAAPAGAAAAASSAPQRDAGGEPTPPAMWPQKITIDYSSISGSQMPLYLAAENGLYAKHGLEVEVVYVASGTSTMQSLVSGDMQF